MTVEKIRFLNEEFVLIGGDSIAKKEAYENFESSFAHLFPDGIILRHGQQIGTKEDIEFIKEK